IVLVIGTGIFGILTVVFSMQAISANNSAKSKASAAAVAARNDQKKLDEAATTKQNESPFRTYTAPAEFGSFSVSFPKTWNFSVDQEPTGNQVTLKFN